MFHKEKSSWVFHLITELYAQSLLKLPTKRRVLLSGTPIQVWSELQMENDAIELPDPELPLHSCYVSVAIQRCAEVPHAAKCGRPFHLSFK
jgi:hypothetical protein